MINSSLRQNRFYLCSFCNNNLLAVSLEIFSRPSANSSLLTSSIGYHFPALSTNTSSNFLSPVFPPPSPKSIIFVIFNFLHKRFLLAYIKSRHMRCEFSALIVQIQQDPLKHKYRIIYKDLRSLNRFQRLLPLHSSKICQASYSRIAI